MRKSAKESSLSATSESMVGAIFLQGGHHSAPKSASTVLSAGILARYSSKLICLTERMPSTGLLALFQAAIPPSILYAEKPFSLNHCVAAPLRAPLRQYVYTGFDLSSACTRSLNSAWLFQLARNAFLR